MFLYGKRLYLELGIYLLIGIGNLSGKYNFSIKNNHTGDMYLFKN